MKEDTKIINMINIKIFLMKKNGVKTKEKNGKEEEEIIKEK